MPTIPQKKQIIFCCEGSTEVMLVTFLEIKYKTSENVFKIKDYGGVRDLAHFKSSYTKHLRDLLEIHSRSDIKKLKFIFVIDNDMPETADIVQYIEDEGHIVQLLDPNSESMMLAQDGIGVEANNRTKPFRDGCKNAFIQHFGCKAELLKDAELTRLFSDISTAQRLFPKIIGQLTDI